MVTAAKIVGALVLMYGALIVWMYMSQRKMLYFPREELVATPSEAGLAYEDVNLTNRLGTSIHGWWLPHDKPRFTLLFCHGNGGNISHRLESLKIFHRLGLSILIYDYSGYGQSDGEPGEKATRADARAAWDWLVQERGIEPETIVLFGRSLGGGVAAELAARLTEENIEPAGIILESTFTSVPDMGALLYPWLPVRQLARFQYDSVTELRNVDLAALFLHSPDDEIVPFDVGKRLHDTYGGPKIFVELEGDHDSGFLVIGSLYPETLDIYLDWLERTAPDAPPTGRLLQ